MPSRNRIKIYVDDGHYHVYNRGVEKRDIFQDDQDYRVFFSFLKSYLSPIDEHNKHPLLDVNVTGPGPVRIRPLKSFFGHVSLLSYCLMPNHFHLLLYQHPSDGMKRFVHALCTSYTMYFNRKNKRVGPLFQGPYKAVFVDRDMYLLHLTRYIHLNPLSLTGPGPVNVRKYPYSSYPYYLRLKQASWLHPEDVLAYFRSAQRKDYRDILSYESFVEDYGEDSAAMVGKLAID